ncbi:hypothetical protein U3516DRAFT_788638, partial [Neocallimastix sp. 'constans']
MFGLMTTSIGSRIEDGKVHTVSYIQMLSLVVVIEVGWPLNSLDRMSNTLLHFYIFTFLHFYIFTFTGN